MKDRIQHLIEYKEISAGDLAGILGVQRSNISHILNGRNNPGAVFIEKLLKAFPDVNARWLITGEGPMLLTEVGADFKSEINQIVKDKNQKSSATPAGIPVQPDSALPADKTIVKIVLLYSDGTFTLYSNS